MNKKIPILIALATAAFLVIGAGVWYAAQSVNPAALTQLIRTSVKDATGRDVTVTGPIHLTLFPSVGVAAEHVSLSNADWASKAEMVTLGRMDLAIKLLPLLAGRIEIGRITLSGLDLYLQAKADGTGNWLFSPAGNTPALASAGALSGTVNNEGNSASSALISPGEIAVSDARIHFQNGNGPERLFELQKLSLVQDGDKTDIQLNLRTDFWKLGISGRLTSLHAAMSDWGVKPVKVDADLTIALNEKSLLLKGVVSRDLRQLPNLAISITSSAFELTPFMGASSLAVGEGGSANKTVLGSASSYLFSVKALPFDLLPRATGVVHMQFGELALPDRLPLKNLNASLLFQGDQIDLQKLIFQLGNGSAEMEGSIAQFKSSTPVLVLRGYATQFTLGNVLKSMGSQSKVSGGEMTVAFNLKGSGTSLHQLLGGASGKMQFSVGKAMMPTAFLNDAGDFVVTLLDAINPLRKKTSQTALECAVAYLPITNGQVTIANSAGIQTDRLSAVLSGVINLNTEAVNLSIAPHERSGITTGLDLGGLVRLEGTLLHPKAGINQAGVVNSAISIGLGILTGGASIVAENARSMTKKVQPCADALHPWSDIYPGMN